MEHTVNTLHASSPTELDEKGPKQEETIRFSTENDNESIANNETGLRELLGIQTTFCVKSTNVELDSKMNSKFVYNPQSDKQLSIKGSLNNLAKATTAPNFKQLTKSLVDKHGIKAIVELFVDLNDPFLQEKVVIVLGMLAKESKEYRNKIVEEGGFEALFACYKQYKKNDKFQSSSIRRELLQTFGTIISLIPCPSDDRLTEIIKIFADAIGFEDVDAPTITLASKAIYSYLLRKDSEERGGFAIITESKCLAKLIEKIKTSSDEMSLYCLKILRVLASAESSVYIDELLKCSDFLEGVTCQLKIKDKNRRKESLWILSNIAAGTAPQYGKLLSFPLLVENILKLTEDEADPEVISEILFVLGNLNANCEYSQILELNKREQLKFWALALEKPCSDDAIIASLKGISKILKKNEEQDPIVKSSLLLEFEIQGMISALENLQKHDSDDVYEAAFSLLEQYFDKEYVEGGEDNDNVSADISVN